MMVTPAAAAAARYRQRLFCEVSNTNIIHLHLYLCCLVYCMVPLSQLTCTVAAHVSHTGSRQQ